MSIITVDDLLDSIEGEIVIYIRDSSRYPIVITCNTKAHTLVYAHENEIRFREYSKICQCDSEDMFIEEKWED